MSQNAHFMSNDALEAEFMRNTGTVIIDLTDDNDDVEAENDEDETYLDNGYDSEETTDIPMNQTRVTRSIYDVIRVLSMLLDQLVLLTKSEESETQRFLRAHVASQWFKNVAHLNPYWPTVATHVLYGDKDLPLNDRIMRKAMPVVFNGLMNTLSVTAIYYQELPFEQFPATYSFMEIEYDNWYKMGVKINSAAMRQFAPVRNFYEALHRNYPETFPEFPQF
jgi:hypothetical protein